MKIAAILFSLLTLSSYAEDCPNSKDLPSLVEIKVPTQSYNYDYSFAVVEGRICFKSREGHEAQSWQLIPGLGVPTPTHRGLSLMRWLRFSSFDLEDMGAIISVSADGDNIIAVDENRNAYYAKIPEIVESANSGWNNSFGFLWKRDEVKVPEDSLVQHVSHRSGIVKYYSDIFGYQHPMGAGVSSFYSLDKAGRTISYTDPWLPPTWSHMLRTPMRGTFKAINMGAAASTLFIISKNGEMYTRLFDYDTSGENPIPFWYSYEENEGKRHLPNEDWRKQPLINGPITKNISIAISGEGNSGRTLRVQGWDLNGVPGFYEKEIYESDWTFKASPFVDVNATLLIQNLGLIPYLRPERNPSLDRSFSGTFDFVSRMNKKEYKASTTTFDPFNSPATLLFEGEENKDKVCLLLHMRRVHKPKTGLFGELNFNRSVLQVCPEDKRPEGYENTDQSYFVNRAFKGDTKKVIPVKVRLFEDEGQLVIRKKRGNSFSKTGSFKMTLELK